jgi:hypothetical protein
VIIPQIDCPALERERNGKCGAAGVVTCADVELPRT